MWCMISLEIEPASILPGQRTIEGTRQPPSQLVFFSPRKGVAAASGQVFVVRAVVRGVEHDGVVGDAQFVEQLEELADVHVVLDHAAVYSSARDTALTRHLLVAHVGAEVHARAAPPDEEGLVLLRRFAMNSMAAATVSSSTVSMRFLVSGPVSSILPSAQELDHAARPELLAEFRICGIVLVLRLLFGVQVIEVAEELVETVVGRQMLIRSPRWFLPNWPVA